MQPILWFGLVLASSACVAGLTEILRSARQKMKSRRRHEQVRKWVRSQVTTQGHRGHVHSR
jgi:nitrate reductase gamma subunit